jgi:predicted small secreted protein
MKRIYALWAILILGSVLLASCDNPVGLGSRLSMVGPAVSITEPAPNRALFETDPTVGTLFNVSGTVKDEVKITLMTVTLDYWNAEAQTLARMGREFRWEKQWFTRENDEAPWRPYTPADYDLSDAEPEKPVSPPSWNVNRTSVNWNLPVFMNRMEKGEYFITVSAWNSAGRHDSESAAKLKIKYNNRLPSVKITNPILLTGSGPLAEPRPPSVDDYIFDPLNQPEETSLNLRYFTNSFRDLSYQIEYTISAPTEFSFEITGEHNLDNPDGEKTVYYGWRWEEDEFPPLRGIFTDRGGEAGEPIDTYVKAGGLIEFSEEVRETIAPNAITPMQMITRVKDSIGLEEYKSKGWFLYLPDSDKPYADINFAHKVHWDSPPPDNAPELAAMARGTSNHNNIAYDDDGVKELRWTLYKLKDTSLEVEKIAGSDVITFNGNKKESWSFYAQKSFGTGRFKIVVEVQDIFDTWGEEYHGYFTITSNSVPTVITPLASPDNLTATFWGDSYGNFTIAGTAQIEDYDECNGVNHSVRITEVAIAWIRPDRGVENNFRYSDPNDPGWNGVSGSLDEYGNRVWKTEPTFVPATAGNNNENLQEEWAFTRTLNYFSALSIGIGENRVPFSDQQFRIRVTGGGDAGAPRSSVYSFTTRGDMAAPVVEITEIIIEHDSRAATYAFVSYGVLPSIAKDDRIMLRGTFSDDSIGQWSGLGSERHRTLLNSPEVTWDSETRQFNFGITSFAMDAPDGGRWETGWYTFEEHNTDPIVQLTAAITDVGGRLGTGSSFMAVETQDPVLIRISSDNDDGYYGENKPTAEGEESPRYIDIFLEFNKPVTFLPADGQALTYDNAPRLELNNGGEAFYHSGSGTYRIIFRYFVDGIVRPPLSAAISGRGGGSSPVEDGNPEGRLNIANVNFNGCDESLWKSLTEIPAIFKKNGDKLAICDPSDIFSLAGQKRIIIDKTPPVITGVSSPASTERHHGTDSQIYIEVTFNKDVQITGADSANAYLILFGGNLEDFSARAVYDHVKDARNISFLYTVQDGHDTSGHNQFLGVTRAIIRAVVTDLAGNTLAEYPAIPGSPVHLNGVVVDTVPPEPPVVMGNIGNESYYSPTTFYIGGLEPGGGTVEYHLDYPLTGEPDSGWNTYTGIIAGGQTGPITLDLNGVYRIAARQYDTATSPNRSRPSPVVTVRIDNGAILERIRSSLADGAYAHGVSGKSIITIDMEFRVPVTLAGAYSAANLPTVDEASIALNTSGGSTNLARLLSMSANGKTWTFEYVIPEGAGTPANTFLDVTELDLDGLVINDQYGARVNGPEGWIQLSDLSLWNQFSGQKKMTVLAGRPHVVNPQLGYGIVFTGTQLRLNFDRDIYRGNTSEKLMIRQIADGFRIPVVLTEDKWNDAFIGREDIFTEQGDISGLTGWNSAAWYNFGKAVYENGSNGATPQGNNKLVSDTSVKYVLKYGIDPDVDSSLAPYSMTAVRTLFRAAEALTFIPHDRNITIEGNTLTVNLSNSGRPLPVKGARYEWIFPNGFIQDTLGTPNGTHGDGASLTGADANLTSSNTPNGDRVLFYSNAAEPPVIRIHKGSDIVTFNNNTTNRHALQPVTTTVKINSRTPNAAVIYWIRQTTDSVTKLLAGNLITTSLTGFKDDQWRVPMAPVSGSGPNFMTDAFNSKMRPQSGTLGYTAPAGVDPAIWANYGQTWWADMSPNWGASRSYAPDFEIGSEYYSDGGMIINIRARTQAPGVTNTNDDYGYESAYRSVFVFVNTTYYRGVGSGVTRMLTHNPFYRLHFLKDGTQLFSGLDRVWIRGSDSVSGDTSIPDFPLSRDLSKSRKAKLLTPIDGNATTVMNEVETFITADDIPGAIGSGNNFWFWVTWGINVPAFVDIFFGELPQNASDPYQTPRTNLRYLEDPYVPYKEYYTVFPGRTTAVESVFTGSGTAIVVAQQMGGEFTAPPKTD